MISLPNAEYRYEIKYAVPESAAHLVHAWIIGHAAGFRRAYPQRQVNSLYFDSPDLHDLQVGLAGLTERSKLRLRWYGPSLQTPTAMLEHKQKQGALGRKVSRPCSGPFDLDRADLRQLVKRLQRQDLGELALTLGTHSQAVLFNHYQRDYYETADHRIRLTVDKRLMFFPQIWRRLMNGRFPEPRTDTLVVELKGPADLADEISRIADAFRFRATAFSKFATGLLGMSYLL